MTRPKEGYTLHDGTPVPGVTTIIGELNKPALVGWAGKTVAAAAVAHGKACLAAGKAGKRAPGFPRWTEILYGKRDRAADDGTVAHNLFERHLRGDHVEREDATDGAWTAYVNAAQWLDETSLHIEPHEQPMVSEKYRYGGTPDALAYSQGNAVLQDLGRPYLADWKTGGVYAEHLIQMAAYAQLLRECQGVEVLGVRLVRFSRDHGDFVAHAWPREVLETGWKVFELLLELREPLDALRKRCK